MICASFNKSSFATIRSRCCATWTTRTRSSGSVINTAPHANAIIKVVSFKPSLFTTSSARRSKIKSVNGITCRRNSTRDWKNLQLQSPNHRRLIRETRRLRKFRNKVWRSVNNANASASKEKREKTIQTNNSFRRSWFDRVCVMQCGIGHASAKWSSRQSWLSAPFATINTRLGTQIVLRLRIKSAPTTWGTCWHKN